MTRSGLEATEIGGSEVEAGAPLLGRRVAHFGRHEWHCCSPCRALRQVHLETDHADREPQFLEAG